MFTEPLDQGGTVTYLTRADTALGPLGSGHVVNPAQFVGEVAHHTVFIMPDYDMDGFVYGDLDDIGRYMRALQVARPDLGPEVPYSWVVHEGAHPLDAVVCEGRGKGVTGAHTAGFNSTRYGIAVAGNTSDRVVSAGMVAAYRWIGATFLTSPLTAVATVGHRDTKPTNCPGDSLYARIHEIQPPFLTAPPGDDDMTPEQAKLLAEIDRRSIETLEAVRRLRTEVIGPDKDTDPTVPGDQDHEALLVKVAAKLAV